MNNRSIQSALIIRPNIDLGEARQLIVIEKTPNNLSAFSPDLPGCVATGSSQAEVEDRMRDAIRMHLDGMREDGIAIPEPSSVAEYIEA